jgi:phage baseplate assembly protein W
MVDQINTIRARQSVYADLDFRFILNPNTGDLALKKDAESVKQSIMNILLTSRGERPFAPEFGGNLRAYLFENFDAITKAAMENVIVNSLRNYEPRVKVDRVKVTDLSYRNALSISIDFTILSPEERQDVVEFVVERIR